MTKKTATSTSKNGVLISREAENSASLLVDKRKTTKQPESGLLSPMALMALGLAGAADAVGAAQVVSPEAKAQPTADVDQPVAVPVGADDEIPVSGDTPLDVDAATQSDEQTDASLAQQFDALILADETVPGEPDVSTDAPVLLAMADSDGSGVAMTDGRLGMAFEEAPDAAGKPGAGKDTGLPQTVEGSPTPPPASSTSFGTIMSLIAGGLAIAAGAGGGGSSSQNSLPSSSGVVLDGLLVGSTIFRDLNSNTLIDLGESATSTAAGGVFTLTGTGGRYVASGGVDAATGIAFTGLLTAPSTATVVSPLTSLLTVNSGALTATELKTAFGLTTDPLSFNPFAAGAVAADALAAQKAIAQVAAIMLKVSTLMAAATSTVTITAAYASVTEKLAAYLDGKTNADLSSALTLTAFFDAANVLGAVDKSVAIDTLTSLNTSIAAATSVAGVSLGQSLVDTALNVNGYAKTVSTHTIEGFVGTAGAGNTIEVKEGATVLATGTVGADGRFSVTTTSTLASGNHTLTVTQSAGTTVVAVASEVVKVDIAAPTVVSIVPAASNLALGASTTLTITFDSKVTGFTVADLVDAKGGTFSTLATGDGGTSWTVQFTPNPDRTGPASISVTNASYADFAGNSGVGSSAASVTYSASLTATDGYITGGAVYVDGNDNGLLNLASDALVGTTGSTGSVNITLAAGQDTHVLLLSGGTDIATGLAFTGLLKAPAGSTMITPLTTLLVELMAAGNTLTQAQNIVRGALGIASATDLTSFDPLEVAVTSTTASIAQRANAVDVYTAGSAIADLLSAGAAALQGAATTGTPVSAAAAQQAILHAVVNQLIAGAGAPLDLTNSTAMTTLITAASNDPTIAANFVGSTHLATLSAGGAGVAAAAAALNLASDASVNATTTNELLQALTNVVTIETVVQGGMTTSLAAGATTVSNTVAAIIADAAAINVTNSLLTSTQPAINDTTVVHILDISAVDTTLNASGTIAYAVKLSEAAVVTAGTPTLTVTRSVGGPLTLSLDPVLSTAGNLVFTAPVPASFAGTVTYTSFSSTGVTLTDLAGNATTTLTLPATLTATSQTIAIDTAAPAAPVLALAVDTGIGTDKITSNGTVNVTGLEANSSWEYSTNGTTFTAGTSTSLTLTGDGAKSVTVRQTDASGNVSATSTALTYTIDTTAPTATITPANGNVINAAATPLLTITFSEIVTGLTLNSFEVHGGTLSNLVQSTTDTKIWTATFTPSAGLTGNASVILHSGTVTDIAANANAVNTTLTLVVDASLPASPGLALAADTGSSASDGVTKNTTVNVTGIEANATWQYSTNGGTSFTNGAGSSFTLADGVYAANAIQVKQTDAAGNVSAATGKITTAVTVDTATPAAPTMTLATDSGSSNSDGISSVGTVNVAGIETGASWQFSVDSGANFTTGTGTSFTLATGSYAPGVVLVRQTDLAGNAGLTTGSFANAVTIDATAPTVTPSSPADGGLTLGLASNMILSANETVVKASTGTITLFNGTTNVAIETINVTDAKITITGTGANTQISINPTADLVKDQTYYIQVSSGAFTDVAGNAWTGITNTTGWNFTGAGATVVIATVSGDDRVNLAESGATIAVSGTVAAEPAVLAAYTVGNMTAVLHPTTGADVTLTGLSYTPATGAWSAVIPATLSGTQDATITVTFTGTTGPANGIIGVGTKVLHIDTGIPAAPTINAVATDNIINASEQSGVITGTNEAGATVALSIAGVTRAATVTGTTWSYTLTAADISNMGQGAETLSATQTDAAGNVSGAVTRDISIDTGVPSAPTINAVATDNIINTTEQTSVISGTNEAGATVALSIGGVARAATVTSTTWSYTLSAGDITNMGQGAETLSVTQTDAAGNTSPAATLAISVDTVLPTAPVINPVAGDNIINATEQSSVISGTNEAGATVALSLGGATRAATVNGTTWSYTLTAGDITNMGEGAETLSATQTDTAGNISTAGTRAITVDTLVPAAPTISAVATDNIINASEQTSVITGTNEAGATVALSIGGLTRAAVVTGSNWSYTLTPADITNMGQGAETLSATQTDAAGNVSVAVTRDISIDTGVPNAPVINAVAGDNIINATETTSIITGTNEANATVALSIGGATRAAVVSGTTWSYTLTATDVSNMQEGAETLSATQTDLAGNISAAGTRNISVDTGVPSAPTVNAVATDNIINAAEQSSVISGTNEAGATVSLSLGSIARAAAVTGTTWSYTLTATDITNMAQGAETLSATQTDAAGNTSPAGSRDITVDTVAPTVTPSSPADGGLTLGLAANLILSANETVIKGTTGSITLFNGATNAVIETISVTDAKITITGTGANTQISINPTADLVKDQTYYIQVSSGAFTDVAGNAWTGITNTTGWNFTGAGATVVIGLVSGDDRVNLAESGAAIAVTGTVAAEAGVVADYTVANMVAVLHPTTGADIPLTNLTYTPATGVWSAVIPAGLSGTQDATLTVTFTGTTGLANGIIGVGTKVLHIDTQVLAPTLALATDSAAADSITNVGTVNVSGLESGATWAFSIDAGANFTAGTGSSFTLSGDGAKSVIVKQTDLAGNTSSNSVPLTFTLDTQVATPTLSLATDSGTSGSDKITNTGTVNVTGLEAGGTWAFSTNGGTSFTTGTGSSFTLSGDGAKSVIVKQTDVAGNVSSNSTALAFTLDSVASAPTLALAADTGSNTTDKITSNGTVNVSGLESGATWAYSTDGGTNFTAGTGTSFTLSGDGAKSVVVKQTDLAGNTSSNSTAFVFTLDGTPPAAIGAQLAVDSGAIANDDVTNNGLVSISGLEANATWQFSTNGGTSFVAGVGTSFTLAAGTYAANSVQFRQIDLAGNVGAITSNPGTVVVDQTAPAAPAVALAADTGASATDGITKNTTVNVTGIEGTATWQFSTDGGANFAPGTGSSFTLAAGTYAANAIQVKQTDLAGNVSTTGKIATAVTVDITLPAAPTLALATDSGVADGITNVGTVNVSGLESGATWAFSTDGTNFTAGTGSSFTVSGVDGAKSVIVRQTDVAGNVGSNSSPLAFTLDTTVATPTLSLATDSGTSGSDKITNTGTVNVTGLEAGGTWAFSTNGGTSFTTGTGSSFTLSGDGAKSVIVKQTDVAGNVSSNSTALAFTLDSVASAPTLALAADTGSNTTDKITSNGTVNVSGLESGATWAYSTDGGTNFTAGTGTSFTLSGDGAKSVVVKQTDLAGNTSSNSTAFVFTLDATVLAPTFNAVAVDNVVNANEQFTVINGSNEAGATVALSIGGLTRAATVNGTTWSYTLVAADITNMGQGAETLSLTQTDLAGNVSVAATRDITVDTVAPTSNSANFSETVNPVETITLSFDEPVTAANINTFYTVKNPDLNNGGGFNGQSIVTGLSGSGTATLNLTTNTDLISTDVVRVSFFGPVSDLAGNQFAQSEIWIGGSGASIIDLSNYGTSPGTTITLRGNGGADQLTGTNADDVLIDGGGTDFLTGSRGADSIRLVENGGVNGGANYNRDTVVVRVGDSNASVMDTIRGSGTSPTGTGFDIASTTVSNHDVLSLQAATIAANVTNAADNGATNVGALLNHSITGGIVTFFNANTGGSPVLINTTNLADALSYLAANITTPGTTVAFRVDTDNSGGIVSATDALFVFQDNGTIPTAGNFVVPDTVVRLNGMINVDVATLLSVTSANVGTGATNAVQIIDTSAPEPVGLALTANGLSLNFAENTFAPATANNIALSLKLSGITTMPITGVTGSGTTTLNIVTSTNLSATDWVLLKYSGTDINNAIRDSAGNLLTGDDPNYGGSAFGSSGNNVIDLSNAANFAATGGYDLEGFAGNDTLIGSVAGDEFNGGTGADTMTGGVGSDHFRFEQGDSPTGVVNLSAGGTAGVLGNGDTFTFAGGVDRIVDFTVNENFNLNSLQQQLTGLPGVGWMGAQNESPANSVLPTNGLASNQGFFMVQGNYVGTTFTVDNTASGHDVLVMWDGDSSAAVTQTGIVLSGVSLAELRAFTGDSFVGHAFVPTLALAADTGASSTDGITTNGIVNAGLENGATWEYSTNNGANFTTGTGSSFTLSAGQYAAGAVQVRQTGNNASPTGTLGAVTIDQTSPTVSITHGAANATTGAITYNFAFTEAMSGFISSDVTLGNGAAGAFSSTDSSHYSLVINPTPGNSPSSLAVSLATNVATDIAGNPNVAGNTAAVSTLYGDANANLLTSGTGSDLVFMGAGADTLKITTANASTAAAPDTVLDFGGTDKIDFATLLGAAGYSNSLQNDTGAGFVELRNLTLTAGTGVSAGQTLVKFDIHLDAISINGSQITGAVIDLDYNSSVVNLGSITSVKFDNGITNVDVWPTHAENLVGVNATRQIALAADLDAANTIVDVNGNTFGVTLRVPGAITSFAVGLDPQSAGGATQFTLANGTTVFPAVGVPKIAGVTVVSNNVLEIYTDTGTLGVVGDNQLHMFATYDAPNNLTHFQMAYDLNPSIGTTNSSNVVAIDFVGDVTANLIPSHLTFI